MSSKDVHRFAAYCSDYTNRIIEKLAEEHQIGKAGLLEALVLGCESRGVEVGELIEAGIARRREVNPDKRKLRSDKLARLQRLSNQELDALLALAALGEDEGAQR